MDVATLLAVLLVAGHVCMHAWTSELQPPRFHDCVPWGARVRHDPEWPVVVSADFNLETSKVWLVLGTSFRLWRHHDKHDNLRQKYSYTAQPAGSSEVVKVRLGR